jgi:predicted Zn finger-like uncharacterized protein
MPIRITCPSCAATLSVKDENAGRAVKCPKCEGVIPVPTPVAPPPPPAPASPPPAPAAFDDFDDEPAPKIKGAMAKSSARSSPPAKSKAKSYRDDDDDDDDYDDRPRGRGRAKSGGGLGDYLTFRKMIVPVVIQIIFWVLVLVVLGMATVGAALSLASGQKEGALIGIGLAVVLAPLYILLIRMYCEVLIVIFRMNDTLSEIRDALTRRD